MAGDPYEQETPLNRAAFFALKNYSADARKTIAALLRSDDPIHPVVREVMAEAFEQGTVDGTRLVLEGGGANLDRFKGLEKRRRDMEIAAEIEALVAAGAAKGGQPKTMTVVKATTIVSGEIGKSYETCRDARTYSRKCSKWVQEAQKTELLKSLSVEGLENMFHSHEMEKARKKAGRQKRGKATR